MKSSIAIMSVLAALGLQAAVEVNSVTAKQRWPWNNLVDVDFTLVGTTGERYRVEIDAQCAGGTKKFAATTFASDPIVEPGANRVTWDFGRDYPGIRAEDMTFAVSVTPVSGSTKPLYCVIDLSAGATAASYPVRYTSTGPAHVQGATDEPCQTTELWFRRMCVPSFAFPFTKYNGFWTKLTKDYYIGVFELTQKQYERIVGTWPGSYFTNGTYRASRPVENVEILDMTGCRALYRGQTRQATASSPLGLLSARTGLNVFLPTRCQLEFAARGGTQLQSKDEFLYYNVNGAQVSVKYLARYGASTTDRNADLTVGTSAVGSYLPNDYGLYDVLGNVLDTSCERQFSSAKTMQACYQEYAGDDTAGDTAENPVVDPTGPVIADMISGSMYMVTVLGGSWSGDYGAANLWAWTYGYSSSLKTTVGYRLSFEVE